MLDVIRYAGNESVHVGEGADDVLVLVLDERNTELIDFLFESINDLVDELRTKPSRQRGLAQSLPESVRAGIEQRRTAAERKRVRPATRRCRRRSSSEGLRHCELCVSARFTVC